MGPKSNGSATGAAHLLALAKSIVDRTEDITKYLESNGLEAPSFSPNYDEPSETPEYMALHSSLKASLDELSHLVDGPKRYLRSLLCQTNDLVAFQVAFEFDFFGIVPHGSSISIDDLATKAGLDIDRTARCVRMLATHHVFQELEPSILLIPPPRPC
ncbi:hypothetical protein G7054_g2977 [Neopestalotiopsis clavispora]|nr:hypothetical protein G7054_g2977 [Neopestalotiopsis clavispora]